MQQKCTQMILYLPHQQMGSVSIAKEQHVQMPRAVNPVIFGYMQISHAYVIQSAIGNK